MSKEYIEREDLLELVEHLDKEECCKDCYHLDACDAWVRNATRVYDDYSYSVENCPYYVPTADVVEVRHGVWIEEEKEVEFYGCIDKQTFYKCSLCGRYEEKDEPYCHCGAKMDGGKE